MNPEPGAFLSEVGTGSREEPEVRVSENAANQEPRLRLARREDLPAIMAMLADDILGRDREGGAEDAVAAAFDEIERDPKAAIWVVELDGRVVGCAQLTCLPGLARRAMRRGLVESVRITSDLRGRGLGRWFMGALIEKAREAGCGVVQLTSDKRRTDAHRFYLGLGFAMSHEGFKLVLD